MSIVFFKKMSEYKYKINQFARIIGVTPKALRLYEKMGLLCPAHVDSTTGYRYYITEQISNAALIVQLKGLGFSLNEVKAYQNNKMSLQQKRELLYQKQRAIDEMLLGLNYLEVWNGYTARVKTEPALSVCSKTVTVKHFRELTEIAYTFAEAEVLPKHRLLLPEHFTAQFLDGCFCENNMQVRFCLGIVPNKGETFEIKPAGKFLATEHNGNYDTIKNAYEFLFRYARLYNIKIIGPPEERYLDNYNSKESEDEYLTEVRLPIE